jgi:hypothetical protein
MSRYFIFLDVSSFSSISFCFVFSRFAVVAQEGNIHEIEAVENCAPWAYVAAMTSTIGNLHGFGFGLKSRLYWISYSRLIRSHALSRSLVSFSLCMICWNHSNDALQESPLCVLCLHRFIILHIGFKFHKTEVLRHPYATIQSKRWPRLHLLRRLDVGAWHSETCFVFILKHVNQSWSEHVLICIIIIIYI